MNTGIGLSANLYFFLCSLHCTNQPPKSLSCSLKKKKEKKFDIGYLCFVVQITYIQACNPMSGISVKFLELLMGTIAH